LQDIYLDSQSLAQIYDTWHTKNQWMRLKKQKPPFTVSLLLNCTLPSSSSPFKVPGSTFPKVTTKNVILTNPPLPFQWYSNFMQQ